MDDLILSLRNLNLEDNPKTIIICYRPIFNKDNTVSQDMIRETVEIDHSQNPPKRTIKKTEKVREFTPVNL